MNLRFFTASAGQTKKIGKMLAEEILKTRLGKKAVVIGLVGDLGGGKTTFVQGMAKGFGIKEKTLSPTFILIKKFQIPISDFQARCSHTANSKSQIPKFQTFYHIDSYRIQEPKELLSLGFKEIVFNSKNIVVIEWADRIRKILPKKTVWIRFEFIDNKTRKIMLK